VVIGLLAGTGQGDLEASRKVVCCTSQVDMSTGSVQQLMSHVTNNAIFVWFTKLEIFQRCVVCGAVHE